MNPMTRLNVKFRLAFLLCCMVFGGGLLSAGSVWASSKIDDDVVLITRFQQAFSPEEVADQQHANIRFQYDDIFHGASLRMPVSKLRDMLHDQRIRKVRLNTFLKPAGTADDHSVATNARPSYLPSIGAEDLPLNELSLEKVNVGVIDAMMDVDRLKEADTPTDFREIPSMSDEKRSELLNNLKFLSKEEQRRRRREERKRNRKPGPPGKGPPIPRPDPSWDNDDLPSVPDQTFNELRRHGTRSAQLIGGPEGTGVAPGVNLHFYSTVLGTALKGDPHVEGKLHMEAVLDGLDRFADESRPKMDAVLLNLAAKNPTGEWPLEDYFNENDLLEGVTEVHERGTVVVVPSGDQLEPVDGGFLQQDIEPAYYDETVTVSALKSKQKGQDIPQSLAEFSNYGKRVDLTAPGIVQLPAGRNQDRTSWEGTSVSAALATGAMAVTIAPLKGTHVIDESSDNNKTRKVEFRSEIYRKLLTHTGNYPENCQWKNDPDQYTEPLVNTTRALKHAQRTKTKGNQHEFMWDLLFSNSAEPKIISIGGYKDDGSIMSLLFPQSHFPKKENGEPLEMSFFGWQKPEEIKKQIKQYARSIRASEANNRKQCGTSSNGNIVIFAHGLGASTALKVLQQLEDDNVPIHSLVTVDGVHHRSDTFLTSMTAPNVGYWLNIHLQESIVDQIPSVPGFGHLLRSITALTPLIDIPAEISSEMGEEVRDVVDDFDDAAEGDRDEVISIFENLWKTLTSPEGRSETLAAIHGKWGEVDQANENFHIPLKANISHLSPWAMYRFWVETHFRHIPFNVSENRKN